MTGERRTLDEEISSVGSPGATGEPVAAMGYHRHIWADRDGTYADPQRGAEPGGAIGPADTTVGGNARPGGVVQASAAFDVWHTSATGSTNADLVALVASGRVSTGTVLIADHQRSGRGRQDRLWLDEPGTALLSSTYWVVQRHALPVLPFAVGLAVSDAVEELCGAGGATASVDSADFETVVLKWPNDVLVPALAERKLAGILVEVTPTAGSTAFGAVIGMGLNLHRASSMPEEIAGRVATLEEIAVGTVDGSLQATRDRTLRAYLQALEARLAATEEPSAVLDAYRSRCATLGRTVRFETAGRTVVGTAVDVGEDGALAVLDEHGHRHRLTAGDAHHL